jgi:hypothetical protein
MENPKRSDSRPRHDDNQIAELVDEFEARDMIPETTEQMVQDGELDGDPRAILEQILEERR